MTEVNQAEKRQPLPPKQPTEAVLFFEKYYDQSYQAYYYYNPKDGSSVWEVPPGAIIADMTLSTDISNA
jgi:hypothetical protein